MRLEQIITQFRFKVYNKIKLSNFEIDINQYKDVIFKDNYSKPIFYNILDNSDDWKDFTLKTFDYFYSNINNIDTTYQLLAKLFDFVYIKEKKDKMYESLKDLPKKMTERFTNDKNKDVLPTGGFDKFLHFIYAGIMYKRFKSLSYPLMIIDKLISIYEKPKHIIEDIKADFLGIKYYKERKREELKLRKKYNFKVLPNLKTNENSMNDRYEMFINKTTRDRIDVEKEKDY